MKNARSRLPENTADVRVAIVAQYASARMGGEGIIPLHLFRFLRRHGVDAYLVVHCRTQAELASLLPEERERLFYVPDTRLHRLLWMLGRRLPDRVRTFTTGLLMGFVTELHQRRVVESLVHQKRVNIVHQPIPVSPRMPSLIYNVGVPVVIGPMNGGMTYPPAFRSLEGLLERAFWKFGCWANGVVNWLVPGKMRAAILLVANERTRRALPPGVRVPVQMLVENGVVMEEWPPVRPFERDGAVPRFAFVGRLVNWKMVDLLLEAFARVVRECPARLDIIGDGPERPCLQRLAGSLGIASSVEFHGFLPQSRVNEVLRTADALVLPSVLECGGAVVLEAMALALPVIATDWGGPSDYLNETCGILIEPASRSTLVHGFDQAMRLLASSPELRHRLGSAGRRRIEQHYCWDLKVRSLIDVYRHVIGDAGQEPVLRQ